MVGRSYSCFSALPGAFSLVIGTPGMMGVRDPGIRPLVIGTLDSNPSATSSPPKLVV